MTLPNADIRNAAQDLLDAMEEDACEYDQAFIDLIQQIADGKPLPSAEEPTE